MAAGADHSMAPPRPIRTASLFALVASVLTLAGVGLDGGDHRDLRQALPVALLIGAVLGYHLDKPLRRQESACARCLLGTLTSILGLGAYALLFPGAHGVVEMTRGVGLTEVSASVVSSVARSGEAVARLVPLAGALGAVAAWLRSR